MKKILKFLFWILVLINLFLVFSGKTYIYKALWYNFVDIDDYKIFNNRTVTTTIPVDWNIGNDYNKQTLSPILDSTIAHLHTVAFLIIKEDSIRYEKYWDQYNDSSLSGSFSMAKSIVSILIGVAMKEGKIKSLDQSVADFIPEFKEGDKSKITIRHLLMMSSGLKWDEAYQNPWSITTEAYYGTDLYNLVANLKSEQEPGKYFNYQSCNSELLAMVIKKATDKTLSEYASEKLWIPVHANHAALWSLDKKDGVEKAYCCFNSNARDFARIGKLYLQKGNWNGKQIVDTNYVEESTRPAPTIESNGKLNNKYGLHWWIIEREGHHVFYARGILGQYVFVIPDKNIIITRLGSGRGLHNADGQLSDVVTYIDEVIKMYP